MRYRPGRSPAARQMPCALLHVVTALGPEMTTSAPSSGAPVATSVTVPRREAGAESCWAAARFGTRQQRTSRRNTVGCALVGRRPRRDPCMRAIMRSSPGDLLVAEGDEPGVPGDVVVVEDLEFVDRGPAPDEVDIEGRRDAVAGAVDVVPVPAARSEDAR